MVKLFLLLFFEFCLLTGCTLSALPFHVVVQHYEDVGKFNLRVSY